MNQSGDRIYFSHITNYHNDPSILIAAKMYMMLGEYRAENFIHIKIIKNLKTTKRSLDEIINEGNIFTLPYQKHACQMYRFQLYLPNSLL